MSVDSATLRRLAALALSPEQMSGVLEILADSVEAEERRRGNQAERKRRQRVKGKTSSNENHPESVTVTGQSRDSHKDSPQQKKTPPDPLKENTSSQSSEVAPAQSRRGSRLPADWQPTADDIATAKAEGLSDNEVRREVVKFRDYWIGRAGKDAVKADWSATWRNWVRRTAENLGRSPPAEQRDEHAERLAYFERTGNWHDRWGPRPETAEPRSATA